ncbi:MAG: DUF2905 domain-containing protein [Leptospiraceae bacterium]|nr:DUF2905 domain-containing protein [Leptospiraceae bacterium]MCP5502400.1 DUF2905 domain-containing protein [Leptospiraceae bacterium]
MAKYLILIGIFLTVSGILLYVTPGVLNWFGRLPGDIRIETENTKVFIPFTSMIIVSLLLSLLSYFLNR